MSDRSSPFNVERVVVTIDPDLEDIVPGFLENRRKDLLALRSALFNADWLTIRVLGHRMKGDGGGYGFEIISIIGQALEAGAKREDRAMVEQEICKLGDFLARVDVVYRK